jgi:hypothetical protein
MLSGKSMKSGQTEIHWTHQLLAYGDVNQTANWAKTSTVKANIKALLDSSKKIGLEVNCKKTDCRLMS